MCDCDCGDRIKELERSLTHAIERLAHRPLSVVAPDERTLWKYVEAGRKRHGRER